MPVDADLESESTAADGNVAIRQHYYAFYLYRHYFLVNHSAVDPCQIIVAIVHFAVVVKDYKREIAVALALGHACL